MISFGFLQPVAEIAPDRVVITRPAKASYVLLALTAPGIVLFALAMHQRHVNMTIGGFGILLVGLGCVSLGMTPWLTPERIELSHQGLAWGKDRFLPSQLVSVRAIATTLRSSPYKKYSSWQVVVIVVAPQRGLRIGCGNHAPWTKQAPLFEVERALNRVLWDAKHRPLAGAGVQSPDRDGVAS